MKVEFYRHSIDTEAISAAAEALHGKFLSTGQANRQFEGEFAALLGVRHAVTTNSCTAALQIALRSLDLRSTDEVITTPLSYVATAGAILNAGVRVKFADVEAQTGLLDPERVAAAITHRTRAIVPVHLYGQMTDMRLLREIADHHGLAIIEDAAHAIEACRDGIRPGQYGDAAAFSFHSTKSVTCGEGGALITNSDPMVARARLLRNLGVDRTSEERYGAVYQPWDMLELGGKFSLTNFQAAMLRPQLKSLDLHHARRAAICRRYAAAFNGKIAGPQQSGSNNCSAHHLFTIWVKPERRHAILLKLAKAEIEVGVHYRPIHLTRYFRNQFGYTPGTFPNAERIGASTISLPCHPLLTDEQIDYVAGTVIEVVAEQPRPAGYQAIAR